jgi:hypothetical protein
MCRLAGDEPVHRDVDRMIDRYLDTGPAPGYGVFRARLGLAVVDLASAARHGEASHVHAHLIRETLDAGDGYTARDVLADDGCKMQLTRAQQGTLISAVQSAGLGLGAIPAPQMADLLAAVKLSATVLERSLCTPTAAQHLRGHVQQQAPLGYSTINGSELQ